MADRLDSLGLLSAAAIFVYDTFDKSYFPFYDIIVFKNHGENVQIPSFKTIHTLLI
jgi:hypothetical protein